jgi:Uma2 family endonuclease
MTWSEVCDNEFLNGLEWRVETDRFGNIVMSPPPRSRHGEFQGEILRLLFEKMEGGIALPECPLETSEGVKAIDVAWVSRARRASKPNDPAYVIAPEICVEVMSPRTSEEEIDLRKQLFFEKGAVEFWLCDMLGQMTFFDAAGPLSASKLCPDFPARVEV